MKASAWECSVSHLAQVMYNQRKGWPILRLWVKAGQRYIGDWLRCV